MYIYTVHYMDTNIGTFSVTDLRHNTSKILEAAQRDHIVYVVSHSKPKAAIISAEYLRALQQAHEDYLDTLEYDETVNQKRISLDQYKKRRQKGA